MKTAVLFALLGICLPARAALAQEAPPAGERTPPATTTAQPIPAASTATPTPVAPPEPEPNAVAKQSPGPIEWLPPSAYPEPRTRGIMGGSLRLNHDLHGLQWPYYPRTGIGVSGGVWIDTGYEHVARGESLRGSPMVPQATEPSTTLWLQQGRFWLRVTPTWSDGNYFVQGDAELVADHDQTTPLAVPNVDDMWIRVGKWKTFDVTVGRYEAWELFHLGMGLDLHTLERDGASSRNLDSPPGIYGVSFAFYRPTSALGRGALHVYATDWLRFEVGTEFGADPGGNNALAARPVGIVDLGWLKLKAGAEYREATGQIDGAKQDLKQRGVGGTAQFVIDPYVEFGVNAAFGIVDSVKGDGQIDAKGSYDTHSLGAFANGRVIENLLVGAGLDYTYKKDTQFDPNLQRAEDFDHWQAFGAVQYLLFKQVFIKGVFAYALADFNPNMGSPIYKNEMLSGRLRLMYLF